jgi:hypothetical protein
VSDRATTLELEMEGIYINENEDMTEGNNKTLLMGHQVLLEEAFSKLDSVIEAYATKIKELREDNQLLLGRYNTLLKEHQGVHERLAALEHSHQDLQHTNHEVMDDLTESIEHLQKLLESDTHERS